MTDAVTTKRARESLLEGENGDEVSKRVKVEESGTEATKAAEPENVAAGNVTEDKTEKVGASKGNAAPAISLYENEKHPREEDTTGDIASNVVEKKLKAEQNEEAAQDDGKAEEAPAEDAPVKVDNPVKIKYKTFATGKECRDYFFKVLHNITLNVNLNEYEREMVVSLVKQGHPDPARKIGGGVKAVQIRKANFDNTMTTCFYLIREDGSEDDVSVRKCIAALFPSYALDKTKEQQEGETGKRGKGRGKGRSRGRRGRGRGLA